jgi:hypothetical protein
VTIFRVSAPLLIALAALLLVDCDLVVPRHGWDRKQWGPMVPHDRFPADCSLCHIADRWDLLREDFEYDHEQETGYALTGAHARAACLRCHNDRGPVEIYVVRGCGGCHVDPHKSTLGLDCVRCHNEEIWEPIGLIADHAQTRLPLVAAHAVAACESCHDRATVGDFRGAPVQCHLCHQQEAAAAFPNHVVNGWNRECERCHTPVDWHADGFNHAAFPLQGGHAGLACTQCHAGGLFVPIPPDCFACHQNDYVNAPNHVANNYSTDCTLCHNTTAWK